ncbi:MAG: DUF6644 family protein [Vicinamibacterales bacterium]
MAAILGWCQWLENTDLGTALRESTLMFPVVEGTHLLALGVSVGTIAISDLRLLGWTMRRERVSDVMGQLLPWAIGGFVVMMVTGALLFWSEAVGAFNSLWFRIKMLFLVLGAVNALAYHLTIHRRLPEWDRDPVPPPRARLAGLLSLLFWAVVIAAGRSTAYNMK